MAETMQVSISFFQAMLSIAISITVLLTVGITVGRVLESIKNNKKELADSLDTFKVAIKDMVEGLVSRVEAAEQFIDNDTRRRENYRMWRISTNRDVRRTRARAEQVAGRTHDLTSKIQALEINQSTMAAQIRQLQSMLDIKET